MSVRLSSFKKIFSVTMSTLSYEKHKGKRNPHLKSDGDITGFLVEKHPHSDMTVCQVVMNFNRIEFPLRV